ncbi:hypothetical protein MK974_00035 [Burkholderia ambifaria]|uniref:hypothetical protein n=1 Tax=Burkholderia ambifaria TaxID=152480 RepID=UPI0022A9ED91|nr:hypothetical protein [Burkholderia ambifaria]WAS54214.1 hypothetical protein MK974_00035 [Burkholderia ambifaria]
MEQLIQHLPRDRSAPRLWFERVGIFSEPNDNHIIRTISFQRGLNIIWAKEPVTGRAHGTRAAGHGVGKTSLCLLLRFCLGDASDAVAELRDELFGEFAHGGIIAVVHVDDQPFIVCRYFNAHKEGLAWSGADITGIWTRPADSSDRALLKKLADDMMSRVSPARIPETGQVIEWRHLLAWLGRDQGARFKSFYAWRDGEGNLLQRRRQDPPIVMRAVLGLLDQGESRLLSRIAELEGNLEKAKDRVDELLKEPALIRRRIESSLRARGQLSADLPIRTDDLFADSVERRIRAAGEDAEAWLVRWEAKQQEDDQALADLRASLKLVRAEHDKAGAEYNLAEAARRGDEDAFRSIGAQLLRLRQLTGHCDEGNVLFSECQHVKQEVRKLELASIRDTRDKRNLQIAMDDSVSRAGSALLRKNDLLKKVEDMERRERELIAAQSKTRLARRTAEIEANKWPDLLDELDRWERTSGSTQAQKEIDVARAQSAQIEQELARAQTQLAVCQQTKSTRERDLASITDGLTQLLLPDGAVGTFDPRDELRPFRLSMRGGEAFRVLEVLLGDVACMLDSPRAEGALPGLFIHDCPREADMSTGLYENFLSLIDSLQKEQYPAEELPFQYIVTTTTPPPVELRGDVVRLILDPSSDEGLLFRRRFVGERQELLR